MSKSNANQKILQKTESDHTRFIIPDSSNYNNFMSWLLHVGVACSNVTGSYFDGTCLCPLQQTLNQISPSPYIFTKFILTQKNSS